MRRRSGTRLQGTLRTMWRDIRQCHILTISLTRTSPPSTERFQFTTSSDLKPFLAHVLGNCA